MDDRPPSVVVIGAWAGGVGALKTLAAGLPVGLPAAVAVVLHVSPRAESRLPSILAHAGPLPASHATGGEPLRCGHIYVAPPDRHLLLRGGRCVVARGPQENNARPAIDPLFRSAAAEFGRRVVAAVLSGALSDGVAGAAAVSKVGGAMEQVLERLPRDLGAALIIVLHLTPQHRSLLAEILGRRTELTVKQAEDGDELASGTVYVAAPDAHLLVAAGGRLRLERSELVHHVRPSADALLLSMAGTHKGRCLAVILSGTGIDGAAGAAAIKQAGGTVLAQDEATSEYFGMPGAAILAGGVDEVLPVDAIARAVIDFAKVPA